MGCSGGTRRSRSGRGRVTMGMQAAERTFGFEQTIDGLYLELTLKNGGMDCSSSKPVQGRSQVKPKSRVTGK